MEEIYQRTQEAVAALRSEIRTEPEIGLVLGTGLGGVADRMEVTHSIPYERIPHFPPSTALGHHGNLLVGTLAGWKVVAMQGRYHYYEGYDLAQVTLPIRVLKELGVRMLVINSAAGGLNPTFRAGDAMIVVDHINFIGANPLRGVFDERLGEPYPDMSRAYDRELIQVASEAARNLKISVRLGVYAAVSGPSLETPAETRMLGILGADAVGMSTAPEVIVGTQVGLRILAMAAITNVNLPDCMEPIRVDTVIANAALADPKLGAILEETLLQLKSI